MPEALPRHTYLCRPVRLVALVLCVVFSLTPATAQKVSPGETRLSLDDACTAGTEAVEYYLIQWQTELRPLQPIERVALPPLHRTAYRLVENVFEPYRDPHQTSTWTGRKPYAVIQPRLVVDVAPDSTFERWEREDYALELNWDRPPLIRADTIAPFRPRALGPRQNGTDPRFLLYAGEPFRSEVIDFFLPGGAAITNAELQRRIRCLQPFLGLTDWVRTSRRMHSPPHLSVLMNESRDRAITAFGWGISGGVWVAYRRVGGTWEPIKPLGRWVY
ncbi:hypothetical protein [Longibacter sp.]|uniref:hypothetical protein n=1 Tax=Longibacter sp. TaxID=2045415 RepID=UPI003EB860D5